MSETAASPKLRAQILSDQEVDAIEGYQAKIRALRDIYLSYELAIADAKKELARITQELAEQKPKIPEQEAQALANLTTQRDALQQEAQQLDGRIAALRQQLEQLQKEVDARASQHDELGRQLEARQQGLDQAARELTLKEERLTKREQAAVEREGEAERLVEHQREILAHTLEVEKRIAQQQGQLTATLEEVKANRLAEAQAKQEAEAARQQAEAAKRDLIIAQQERDDLRHRQEAVEAKYREAVELHEAAEVLETTNKVKEMALRDVEDRLKRETAQLRHGQNKFVEEVEAHRTQCADCAAKAASATPGGTNA